MTEAESILNEIEAAVPADVQAFIERNRFVLVSLLGQKLGFVWKQGKATYGKQLVSAELCGGLAVYIHRDEKVPEVVVFDTTTGRWVGKKLLGEVADGKRLVERILTDIPNWQQLSQKGGDILQDAVMAKEGLVEAIRSFKQRPFAQDLQRAREKEKAEKKQRKEEKTAVTIQAIQAGGFDWDTRNKWVRGKFPMLVNVYVPGRMHGEEQLQLKTGWRKNEYWVYTDTTAKKLPGEVVIGCKDSTLYHAYTFSSGAGSGKREMIKHPQAMVAEAKAIVNYIIKIAPTEEALKELIAKDSKKANDLLALCQVMYSERLLDIKAVLAAREA